MPRKNRPSADPDSFEEALAWHRQRLPMTDEQYDALEAAERERAFTVAGIANLDLVSEVWEGLDAAIANGETLDDFRDRIEDRLTSAWGKEEPWRIETIMRTGLQSAYAAGRYQQMTEPAVLEARPYWRYSIIEDERVCPVCGPCDGVVLRADHPWWQRHQVPAHFRCRCHIATLSAREVGDKETAEPPDVDFAEGFGAPPASEPYELDPSEYPPPLIAAFGG